MHFVFIIENTNKLDHKSSLLIYVLFMTINNPVL